MNAKTLLKFNRFGKVGKIVVTAVMIAAIIAAVIIAAAAIYTATLPEDAVRVTVINRTEFRVNGSGFSFVWDMLARNASYSTGEDPSAMLKDGGVLPPEDTQINAELNFFRQSYSSALIRSEGDEKIIDAASSPAEYRSSDLTVLLAFAALFAASAAVALLALRKLFGVLSVCASPFCAEFVSRLRAFGYSLLPVAAFASVGETLAVRFLTAGRNAGVFIQWGVLIAFAVTMCLVIVFHYGVQLQKESDETL